MSDTASPEPKCAICKGPVNLLESKDFYQRYRCKSLMCSHEGEVSRPKYTDMVLRLREAVNFYKEGNFDKWDVKSLFEWLDKELDS